VFGKVYFKNLLAVISIDYRMRSILSFFFFGMASFIIMYLGSVGIADFQ
jgi:hypothetical protein